jgi:hypothetical protein
LRAVSGGSIISIGGRRRVEVPRELPADFLRDWDSLFDFGRCSRRVLVFVFVPDDVFSSGLTNLLTVTS